MPPPAEEEVEPGDAPPAEEIGGGRRLALVCVGERSQAAVKEALESSDYLVHIPSKPEDALSRLRRNKYELLILDPTYGGSAEKNVVLKTLQPMAMSLRRKICVGLVDGEFTTFDHMAAFAHSVNFVVAERDIPKIKAIVHHAVADNDQFYHMFREALREAGKA